MRSTSLLALAAWVGWVGCGGHGSKTIDTDAASCMIVAEDYDRSCAVDQDCVVIAAANYCLTTTCKCPDAAIAAGARAKYNADVAASPVGMGTGVGDYVAGCDCFPPAGPCCRAGTCTTDCFSPADTLPACADAGGTCVPPGSRCDTPQSQTPPTDACAFADQTCCLH